ncbi:XRE family transcriptional regulator [Streptomyces sp. C10-9-1]|uniref:helix-turn-helix domain-containing protein n=1 Tax=Streptomyces sp. C10-9-1 TaxID=1859285 RepID=UPI0021111AF3|nr:XRE family transcriptional regulator [Streptomyces sp. C10-9-1]MCQ6554936.1 XRE family transcriptional regulator [Streptomyces sp. C10-9-1]
MTARKAMPGEPEPDVLRFVEEVRRTKDALGWSFAALGRATAYSRSSWERCLNGGHLPPRSAVVALARHAGDGSARLLALWELAEQAASGRGRTTPAPAPAAPAPAAPAPGAPAPVAEVGGAVPVRSGNRPRPLVAGLVGAVAVVAAALVLALRTPWGVGDGQGAGAAVRETEGPLQGMVAHCHGAACEGLEAVEQGCGGDAWTAATGRVGQAYVEVRYSSVCRAAWARMTWAAPGDEVTAVSGGRTHTATVPGDRTRAAITAMLGVPTPSEVRACWRTADGEEGCTGAGGDEPLPEPSPIPG